MDKSNKYPDLSYNYYHHYQYHSYRYFDSLYYHRYRYCYYYSCYEYNYHWGKNSQLDQCTALRDIILVMQCIGKRSFYTKCECFLNVTCNKLELPFRIFQRRSLCRKLLRGIDAIREWHLLPYRICQRDTMDTPVIHDMLLDAPHRAVAMCHTVKQFSRYTVNGARCLTRVKCCST